MPRFIRQHKTSEGVALVANHVSRWLVGLAYLSTMVMPGFATAATLTPSQYDALPDSAFGVSVTVRGLIFSSQNMPTALLGSLGPSGKLENPGVWIDYSKLPPAVHKQVLQCQISTCETIVTGRVIRDHITKRKLVAERLTWIKWAPDMDYVETEGLPERAPGSITALDYFLGIYDRAHPPTKLIGFISFFSTDTSFLHTPPSGPQIDVLTKKESVGASTQLRSCTSKAPCLVVVSGHPFSEATFMADSIRFLNSDSD